LVKIKSVKTNNKKPKAKAIFDANEDKTNDSVDEDSGVAIYLAGRGFEIVSQSCLVMVMTKVLNMWM
jgi:hypothetical protein